MAAAWDNTTFETPRSWICGYCDDKVSSNVGYRTNRFEICIRICPGCLRPTYFEFGNHTPQSAFGNAVQSVPADLYSLYEEARASFAVKAYTGVVLICRKILMHVSVEQGAEAGKRFVSYVEHLDAEGYISPQGKGWVDYIRTRGNEANHDIELMKVEDAKALITLVQKLLEDIYQFPAMAPQQKTGKSSE